VRTEEGKSVLPLYDILPNCVPAELVEKYNASPEIKEWVEGAFEAKRIYVGPASQLESSAGVVFDMCHEDFVWDDKWVALATAKGLPLNETKIAIETRRAQHAKDVAERAAQRKIVVAERRAEREAKKIEESAVKKEVNQKKKQDRAIEKASKKQEEDAAKEIAREQAKKEREQARKEKEELKLKEKREAILNRAKLIIAAADAGIENIDDVIERPKKKAATKSTKGPKKGKSKTAGAKKGKGKGKAAGTKRSRAATKNTRATATA
jgi:hypothetical protein